MGILSVPLTHRRSNVNWALIMKKHHKSGLKSEVDRAIMFVCLFDLILYVPVNNLSVTSGQVFLG